MKKIFIVCGFLIAIMIAILNMPEYKIGPAWQDLPGRWADFKKPLDSFLTKDVSASLPNSINATSPADTDLASAGASQIRNVKQFIEDLWGIPDQTSITAGIGILNATTNTYTLSDKIIFSDTTIFNTTTTLSSTVNGNPVFTFTSTGNPTIGGNPLFTGNPKFSGTTEFSGTVLATRASAANFTRITSNYNIRTGGSPAPTIITTSCTTININSTYGIPVTAKTVDIVTNIDLKSGTSATNLTADVDYYSDSGCTTKLGGSSFVVPITLRAYSSLTGAGTSIMAQNFYTTVYVNGASVIYAKKAETGCASCLFVTYFYTAYAYTD